MAKKTTENVLNIDTILFNCRDILRSARKNKISNSQKCYSIGNFFNYGLSYKEGYISLSKINLLYNGDYANFIQCSISIGSGDSGAPLFNDKNEVIGMITFRTKGLTGNAEQCFAYAIPIVTILEIYV